MTAPHPTPAPLAAVAASLALVREQLQAVSKATSVSGLGYGNPNDYPLRLNIHEALNSVNIALDFLYEKGISPASPVTPAPQAPETLPALSAREAALVEAARRAYNYLGELDGKAGYAEYMLLDGALAAYAPETGDARD